jgi:hypothetical protein
MPTRATRRPLVIVPAHSHLATRNLSGHSATSAPCRTATASSTTRLAFEG